MDLIILIGLQASGKTTFRDTVLAEEDYFIVSKDLMGRGSGKAVKQEKMICEGLGGGYSVIVDNTNPSLEDRAELIKLGREYGARVIGYHFKSTREQSLDRNALRHGRARVPYVAIADTLKRFVVPTLVEGFAQLYEVTWGLGKTFIKVRVG